MQKEQEHEVKIKSSYLLGGVKRSFIHKKCVKAKNKDLGGKICRRRMSRNKCAFGRNAQKRWILWLKWRKNV